MIEQEELSCADPSLCLTKNIGQDLYSSVFSTAEHFNWIVEKDGLQGVVSVLRAGVSSKAVMLHQGLLTTEKGSKALVFEMARTPEGTWELKKLIAQNLKDMGFRICSYVFDHCFFRDNFVLFERKHPQAMKTMKIGVLYVRDGQESPQEDWFKNGKGGDALDPQFWRLMNTLGTRTDMATWPKYTGEMNNKFGFYDEWAGVEVVYHLAPELTKEEIRRLIGNDIVVLIFVESGTLPIKPLYDLGNVPQIFIVLYSQGDDQWRAEFWQRSCITHIGPAFRGTVSLATLKQMILTRAFNGLDRTRYCPPMNRLFSIPRRHTLKETLLPFTAGHSEHGVDPKGTFFVQNASSGTCLFLNENKLQSLKKFTITKGEESDIL